jgi:hypothetical protein
MAGLVPAIYVLILLRKDVDARHKAGHDEIDRTRDHILRRRPGGRLEQVLPLPLQRFESLAREPGCRGYGARVAFVADLAQGVADEAKARRMG